MKNAIKILNPGKYMTEISPYSSQDFINGHISPVKTRYSSALFVTCRA